MLDNMHELSIRNQCELLSLNRTTTYYRPVSISSTDLEIMRNIDEIYLKCPFYGARRISWQLKQQGIFAGRKKVASFMEVMGIEALYPKPRTTIPNKQHKKYPYLLSDIDITYPNQVWAADITYIPMQRGFMYLVAIIDWFSRYLIGYELSNSLDSYFCMEALNKAILYCKPVIFNTDQGSQFTSNNWCELLAENKIKISMDGKGRAIDNIIIERFFRSIKYELIYINPADSVRELEVMVKNYIKFYNEERPHQSLKYKPPARLYYG